jgi:hypothetical protein
MRNADIVLVTILGIVELVSLGSLAKAMADMRDHLWIEPVIMVVTARLIYLVVR